MTELEKWVEKLPVTKRNDFLVRLAKAEPNVDVQLLNRLRELVTSHSRQKPVSKQRRTVAELIKSEQEEIEREQQRKAACEPKYKKLKHLSLKNHKRGNTFSI